MTAGCTREALGTVIVIASMLYCCQANLSMNMEIVERALEQARKENSVLQWRLEVALGLQAPQVPACLFHGHTILAARLPLHLSAVSCLHYI